MWKSEVNQVLSNCRKSSSYGAVWIIMTKVIQIVWLSTLRLRQVLILKKIQIQNVHKKQITLFRSGYGLLTAKYENVDSYMSCHKINRVGAVSVSLSNVTLFKIQTFVNMWNGTQKMGTDVRLEMSTATLKQTTEDQIATHIQTNFIFCFALRSISVNTNSTVFCSRYLN